MAARPIGSGMISWGLVTIPVKLYTATSPKTVHFTTIHRACGGRVKQQLVCSEENITIQHADTVKGYEHTRDQFVTFTNDELRALSPSGPPVLEVLEVVPTDRIDLIYVAKSYYLGPDIGGDRSFHTLARSLMRRQRCAVGRFANRGKDDLVVVRPYKNGLVLHECFYGDEVVPYEEVELGAPGEVRPGTDEAADRLLERLESPLFDVSKYRDTHVDRIKEAVAARLAGRDTGPPRPDGPGKVIDLLDALRGSLPTTGPSSVAAESVAPSMVQPKGPRKAQHRTAKAKRRTSSPP